MATRSHRLGAADGGPDADRVPGQVRECLLPKQNVMTLSVLTGLGQTGLAWGGDGVLAQAWASGRAWLPAGAGYRRSGCRPFGVDGARGRLLLTPSSLSAIIVTERMPFCELMELGLSRCSVPTACRHWVCSRRQPGGEDFSLPGWRFAVGNGK